MGCFQSHSRVKQASIRDIYETSIKKSGKLKDNQNKTSVDMIQTIKNDKSNAVQIFGQQSTVNIHISASELRKIEPKNESQIRWSGAQELAKECIIQEDTVRKQEKISQQRSHSDSQIRDKQNSQILQIVPKIRQQDIILSRIRDFNNKFPPEHYRVKNILNSLPNRQIYVRQCLHIYNENQSERRYFESSVITKNNNQMNNKVLSAILPNQDSSIFENNQYEFLSKPRDQASFYGDRSFIVNPEYLDLPIVTIKQNNLPVSVFSLPK